MMTAHDLLADAYRELARLATPELDSEVLLAHVLKKPRAYLLSHPEKMLDDDESRAFGELVARRARHEPIAYITRHKEFYGRDFYVDKRVHIPRPATEDVIGAVARELPRDFGGAIADIGTGSGCIAVTLALEFPKTRVFGTDISTDALAVAQQNAHALGASERITFLNGSLGEPLTTPVDVLVANLPYGWRTGWTRDREVFFQPNISYISGRDGLAAISTLAKQLPRLLAKNGRAYLEFDPRQTEAIKKLATQSGYAATIIKDIAGFDRIARLAAS